MRTFTKKYVKRHHLADKVTAVFTLSASGISESGVSPSDTDRQPETIDDLLEVVDKKDGERTFVLTFLIE